MNTLERLNSVNDIPIFSVFSEEFASYGRILKGYDFSPWINYMENRTEIPENNIYVASVAEMEDFEITKTIKNKVYGQMEIQVGFCNGKNSTFNGFEYHKGSEVNVAVTDFALALGHRWEIKQNHFDNKDAKVFFVPKNTAIEMYQTTLHLSPLRVDDEGFKDIVVLPRGTNTPLEKSEKSDFHSDLRKYSEGNEGDNEARLLLQKNKWVIAHPAREALIKQGAFPGIIGENKAIKY